MLTATEDISQSENSNESLNENSCSSFEHGSRSKKNSGRKVAKSQLFTIDEAVDSIGTGKFQHLVLFAAGTCFMADAMEIMLLSFLTLVLKKEWNLDADNDSGAQTATISSILFLGALVGTCILGLTADKYGRKPVLSASAFIISFFGLATALCPNYWSLLVVRFMVGFGVGGITIPFDILAELLPTDKRGKFLLRLDFFWCLGSLLVPVVAYFTLELANSWRVFVAVCTIPCILSFVCGILYVPESPRWLLLQGRGDEALNILRRAASLNGMDPLIAFPPGCALEHDNETETSKFMDLFTPKWREITLIRFSVCLGLAFCYYGTVVVVTVIFETRDEVLSANEEDSINFDYSAIFISSSAEVLGLALVMYTIDTFGRIPSQVISYACGGICLFILSIWSENGDRYVLIGLAFLTRIFEMSASCVTWISTTEVLSTEIRSTGHSAANAVARVGGFLCPYLVAGNLSLPIVGGVMLFVHMFTAFAASKLPETKGVAMGNAMCTHDEFLDGSSSLSETTELV